MFVNDADLMLIWDRNIAKIQSGRQKAFILTGLG